MWGHYVHRCAQLTHYHLQKHQYVTVISSPSWLTNNSLQTAPNIALIVSCFVCGKNLPGSASFLHWAFEGDELWFSFLSLWTYQQWQVNGVPLLSYSVWGLISTSKPQHEDSIHLSLFLPPLLARRAGLWQCRIKKKSKVFKRNSSKAQFICRLKTSSIHLFFLKPLSLPQSSGCLWTELFDIFPPSFAAGCVRCFWYLVSDEGIFSLNTTRYHSLLLVAISPQTDSSHPPWGMWCTLWGSGSNFPTLIFRPSKMGTACFPCPSLPSAHWLKVKY